MTVQACTYYVIVDDYVGPNRTDADGDYYVTTCQISTEPARGNLSPHGIIVDGWCGTTQDWCRWAHGEYETLEAAQAAAANLGYTQVVDLPDETDDTVVEYRRTLDDSRRQWGAGDWLQGSLDDDEAAHAWGIAADTTDERLVEIAMEAEQQAADQGITLRGGTVEALETLRQSLRDAAAEQAAFDTWLRDDETTPASE